MTDVLKDFNRLRKYVEREEHKGWDPFDGLNSSFFNALPFISKNRIAKLAWLQLFKRLPINLRPLFGVKKDYNAKGVALFISAYAEMYEKQPSEKLKTKIIQLTEVLLSLKNTSYSGTCWGYHFDWQARAFFQPKNTPTVVATSFGGQALIAAYKCTQKEEYLNEAISCTEFILKDLNRSNFDDGTFTFSYSPMDETQVFNAGLLGVRLLAQVQPYCNTDFQKTCKSVVDFVVNRQNANGSWPYGTLPFHQWVDSFHTGYNLECIHQYVTTYDDHSYSDSIEKGLDYYLKNLFSEKGEPKYYNNSLYPIDVHCTSQLLVTLSKMGKLETNKSLASKVTKWTLQNMQSTNGHMYYQKTKWTTIKTPYMRWTQAWMFYALTLFLDNFDLES